MLEVAELFARPPCFAHFIRCSDVPSVSVIRSLSIGVSTAPTASLTSASAVGLRLLASSGADRRWRRANFGRRWCRNRLPRRSRGSRLADFSLSLRKWPRGRNSHRRSRLRHRGADRILADGWHGRPDTMISTVFRRAPPALDFFRHTRDVRRPRGLSGYRAIRRRDHHCRASVRRPVEGAPRTRTAE